MNTIHIDMMPKGGMVIRRVESIKHVMESQNYAEAYIYVTNDMQAVVITNDVADTELHHPADLARKVMDSNIVTEAELTLVDVKQDELPF